MLDRISFLFGEAMQSLRRHGFMTFSAVTTVAIALYLVGSLGYAYISAMGYAKSIPGKFEMYVLLKEGTEKRTISETATAIRTMPDVATVNLIPRTKAWERLKQQQPKWTEGIENPLPDAFKVSVSDLKRADQIADAIRALPAVEPEDGVKYMADEQRAVTRVLTFLQWLSSMGFLLLIIAGILIYNTIRLAAINRQTEVYIMRLVGASRLTVAIPFLLEGVIEGALGGLLSAMFVRGTLLLVTREFSGIGNSSPWNEALNSSSNVQSFPLAAAFAVLTSLGAVYGLICSIIAIRLRPETR